MLTTREIKALLKQERLSISKYRGQNFLVDENIQTRIIQAMSISPEDCLLEIGPGLGALTETLARQAACLIAVDKDKAFIKILQNNLSNYNNIKLFCADILKFEIGKCNNNQLKVIGNLPYYITTPIIAYLLEKQRRWIKEIYITVQEEVGKRLLAQPGNKDYSALTILIQYWTTANLLFNIPKRAFYPQPKVDSVFLKLKVRTHPAVIVQDEAQFFTIVHTIFNKRRKTLLNSLTHKMEKAERLRIQQLLEEIGINYQTRPEQMSIDDFAKIEHNFYNRGIRL
ncbi:MAG: 16S rRNA (adenine(1518)-N(6)/adenine(1519)-N(6))-dimethyltransferase RsmA [Candidatus Omnitrophota bacterium]